MNMRSFFVLCASISALCLPCLSAEIPGLAARYDFSKIENRIAANCAKADFPAEIRGKFSVTPEKALVMDGRTTEVILRGTEKLDPRRGLTFTILYKRSLLADNNAENQHHDAFFYRDRQFAFTRRGSVIYANFKGRSGKWEGSTISGEVFKPGDKAFHHLAMTIRHREEVEMGIDQTEIHLYFDGLPVGGATYRNTAPLERNAPIEVGCGRTFGFPWHIGGEIADPRIYDRVLSPAEIRKLVKSQNLARPTFRSPRTLSADDRRLLEKFRSRPETESALYNLALDQDAAFDWRLAARQPERFLKTIRSETSSLTLLTAPEACRILSWYDHRGQRELLAWENGFFRLILHGKTGETAVSPCDADVKTFLRKPVVSSGKRFLFTIGCEGRNWSADAEYVFDSDRLTYRVSGMKSALPRLRLVSPDLKLRPMTGGGSTLLVPFECGRLFSDEKQSEVVYHGHYPGCNATMQMCAAYDHLGGVFVSSGDPLIRMQELSASLGSENVSFSFDRVLVPGGDDAGTATAELFRGDWYDAGLCYRKLLGRIGAPWWDRAPAGGATPEWLRGNTLWVRYDYPNEVLEPYVRLRKYFGMPFAVHVEGWHERGAKYSLGLAPLPAFLDDVRELQRLGLRVQTYHNGRILQRFDRRGKETCFVQKIAPAVVRNSGKLLTENYPDTFGESYVLCPQTPLYRQMIFDLCVRMTADGLDGVYLDQIGCTTPKLCGADDHGHAPGDPDAWYGNGQRRALTAVRAYWRKKNAEKWISTESNAESCVKICDMMTPWRWLYDDQIPLFQMVYSGRTQFGDRNRVKEEPEAAFVKDAGQIASGEQMGRLSNRSLCSLLRPDYRLFVKRLMYLRKGLLAYFNEGMMDRPPRFADAWKRIPRRWGIYGSKTVSRPPVISSAWTLGDSHVVLLINTTREPQRNKVFLPGFSSGKLAVYSSAEGKRSGRRQGDSAFDFTLEPRGCMVLTDRETPELDAAFRVICRAGKEKDPFTFDPATVPDPPSGPLAAGKFHRALKAPTVFSAHRNHAGNELNYIYFAVVYPGSVKLDDTPKIREITMELSAPDESGDGVIRIFADRISGENLLAEIPVAENFRTKTWRDFKKISVTTKRKLAGPQRLLFCFYGASMCNFRSWMIR